jgi:hypothetical protein
MLTMVRLLILHSQNLKYYKFLLTQIFLAWFRLFVTPLKGFQLRSRFTGYFLFLET